MEKEYNGKDRKERQIAPKKNERKIEGSKKLESLSSRSRSRSVLVADLSPPSAGSLTKLQEGLLPNNETKRATLANAESIRETLRSGVV